MARFKLDDGKFLDTERAAQQWKQKTEWNGNNHIGVTTGSQWHDACLYRMPSGVYYLAVYSRVNGERDTCARLTDAEAAAFFIENDIEPPPDLADAAEALFA